MRLLADECCDASLAAELRSAGHDVIYVAEASAGLHDTDVLEMALAHERVLLTEDKDFGELVIRFAKPAPGLILVRMDDAEAAAKASRLRPILQLAANRFPGHCVVVRADRVRFRPLPSST